MYFLPSSIIFGLMISENVLFHYFMLLYTLLCYSNIIYRILYLIIINSNSTVVLTITPTDIMGNLLF